MPMPSVADLIQSAGKAAPAFFTKDSGIGETITGRVESAEVRQVINFVTGKPDIWEDGSPRLQIHVTMKTELKDSAEDDGMRSVYVKWWTHQRKAFLAATEAAGVESLEQGDILTVAYTDTIPAERKGFDDTKVFEYEIVRPV